MTPQRVQRSKARYTDIEPRADTGPSPLSFQQERLFYLHKLSAEGPLWNRISCKWLVGALDIPLLGKAVDALVERHPALRTRISVACGRPLQSQHDSLLAAFSVVDVSDGPDDEVEERARKILNQVYAKPVPIEGGELFQAVLVRCSGSDYLLILKLHHIISDATTFQILWNDLKALYNTQLGGSEDLSPLEIEYSDYARWVRNEFGEDDTGEQESYWLSLFAGELPGLDLPTDFPAPPNVSFNGALQKQELPKHLVERLQSFSLRRRVIPFSTMLSVFYLLLHHYCRQDDIVVGTVFLGRHYSPKIRRVAGFFSNTVALRTHVDGNWTVEEFVRSVHDQVVEAHAMQDYPFERLVDRLDPDREHNRNPLFRAMFNMVTSHEEGRSFEGVEREEWLEPEISSTQVDFFLEFHMKPSGSEVRVEYNTDVFSKTTIQRMMRHYVILIEKVMDDPGARLRELSLLDEEEEQLVLSLSEGDPERSACPQGILALLEERAASTPDEAAMLFRDEVITCGQLNERVNRLAATLISAGVSGSDTVAIMLERSPEMVLGLLAIWKAGAAYLPIDPSLPEQRIEYILQDSGVPCLLVRRATGLAPRTENGSPLLRIPLGDENSYSGDGRNPGRRIDASSPAYVIYTSGSTGKPKGVVVEHGALRNTLEFLQARYPIHGGTLLLKTNFTFDVSTTELFGWLFDDGRLAVLEPGAEKDPQEIVHAIGRHGVTHVNFVPSMLDAFLSGLKERDVRTLERLKYVFVAGEALKPDLVNRFHDLIRDVRLENLYGPTEAAVYGTSYSLPRGQESKRVPIGKPISNTRSYVLDENLRLLPIGVNGELCLSGPGLARGYLNRPELTAEMFCPNPHWEGQRLYRTGDLARWGDDGQIYFLGRGDGQVKIRGFRVELGEIERKLLACRAVTEVALRAREDQFGQQVLIAYLVMGPDGSVDDVREEVATWLPGYMVPEFFVELERLPRLASGKVDHQSLPEPDPNVSPSVGSAAAPTALEQTIIAIAEELLNTTGLDPNSNFFRLGGNSLLTLRFVAALDDALGTSLSIMDFLELPTIAEAARLIEPWLPARTSEDGIGAASVDGEPSVASRSRSEEGGP